MLGETVIRFMFFPSHLKHCVSTVMPTLPVIAVCVAPEVFNVTLTD